MTQPNHKELIALRDEFQRWIDIGPNGQPHYPLGIRAFSTGDLKAFVAALTALEARPVVSEERAFVKDGSGFSDADCLAILLDSYARDNDRERMTETANSLRRAAALLRSVTPSPQPQAPNEESWLPFTQGIEGGRYMAAFPEPLQPGKWCVVGPGRIKSGVFTNHIGQWPGMTALLPVPPVRFATDTQPGGGEHSLSPSPSDETQPALSLTTDRAIVLEEALRPFAVWIDRLEKAAAIESHPPVADHVKVGTVEHIESAVVTVGDFRRARAALTDTSPPSREDQA